MKNKIMLISCLVILAIISFWYFSSFKKSANFTQNERVLNNSGARYKLLTINWGNADPVWKTFAEQHIEKMRQAEAETPASKLPGYKFDRVFVEVKSSFISKLLPNYQIFTEKYFTYAFNIKTKSIMNIANGWGGAVGNDLYYRNQEFSDFIKTQKIQITDEQNATEFLKLVEDIYRWSDSDNVTYWKLSANKKESIWLGQYEYTGPPEAQIFAPAVWEVVVDKQNYVTEVRQQREQI